MKCETCTLTEFLVKNDRVVVYVGETPYPVGGPFPDRGMGDLVGELSDGGKVWTNTEPHHQRAFADSEFFLAFEVAEANQRRLNQEFESEA